MAAQPKPCFLLCPTCHQNDGVYVPLRWLPAEVYMFELQNNMIVDLLQCTRCGHQIVMDCEGDSLATSDDWPL